MQLKRIKLTDLTPGEKYNCIFPVGATEQHGPFIPFGTDTYITDYIVEKIHQHFPDTVVLPTLEFSRSQEHRDYPGTVWLKEETLIAVLQDVCNSLTACAKSITVVSFHANEPYIDRFINQYDGPVKITRLELFNETDDINIDKVLGGVSDDHAGNSEISNMLAIDSSLVVEPDFSYPKQVIEGPFDTDNLADKSEDGIADNHPEWNVSKEIGQEILDIYVARAVEGMREVIGRS